jgi:multidrug transporter EmrE-like cation transporter
MAKYIPMILFTVLTNAFAQILLKKGMLVTGHFSFNAQEIATVLPRLLLNPFLVFGMLTFIISMASHLLVLSRVDLSFAYPFLSLAYVVVAVYSYFVFGESVNAFRIAGIAFVCMGTILISQS